MSSANDSPRSSPRPRQPVPGVVRADELYIIQDLGARLRLGRKGLMRLRRAGLRVIHLGRHVLVRGQAVLDLMADLEEKENGPP